MDEDTERVSLEELTLDVDFKCWNKFNSKTLSPSLLPWDRFAEWVYCLCVVTFDLELGQALELMYPSHVKLTEKEKASVCYMAFPDSNSGCMGDTQFFFRFRQCPTRRLPVQPYEKYNRSCAAPFSIDPPYLFGYVYFRQVKDKSIRRGYFQKSMVLLTKLPLTTLFTQVLNIIAPAYFEKGEPILETACHDVDQWPSPRTGCRLQLPLMGSILNTDIPAKMNHLTLLQLSSESPHPMPPEVVLIPNALEIDVLKYFQPILSHIQLLWELVITAEPIVVMAPTPKASSDVVLALTSMIWPLQFCSDYRPYFTIHDSEFKEYTSLAHAPPPVILGVTNPFFSKTLQRWPHILRIGEIQCQDNAFVDSVSKKKPKIKRPGNLRTLDSKPGLYTTYKQLIKKDKVLFQKLAKAASTDSNKKTRNRILRHHFFFLTHNFMIPLERYISRLLPLQRNISPHKSTPVPRPFNPDDFLSTVEQCGPWLTTGIKGDWATLYRKFFRTATFSSWYNTRYQELSNKLQSLHIEVISEANLLEWIRDKQEVEIVDLVLRLREKMAVAENEKLSLAPDTLEKLQCHMTGIIESLPEDLQDVLK